MRLILSKPIRYNLTLRGHTMLGDDRIRDALERNVRAVSTRPDVGRGTNTARAVLEPGLQCTVVEGAHSMRLAMTHKYGGTGEGPNPGVIGRAALASCLALGYGMWASRLGVAFDTLEVEVQADYDVRGELGADDNVRPGYGAIRYIVTVTSNSPDADVLRVLDTADRYSPYRDVFANPIPLTREVRIGSSAG
jgi:uncharacterized OsmC-like protein